MKFGPSYVEECDLSSLRLLGSVGEPLNPEAWQWFHTLIGKENCPIVDTYWQSETGAPMITPIPGCTPLKPGSATLPFFGVVPALMDEEGRQVEGPGEGHLVFKQAWPGIMRTVDGDHKRFEDTYFERFPGCYVTGDGAQRDGDGYYFITGRIDDLLNVSGHLLSTAEIESALIENPAIAETAAVSSPHPVKGESLYCFIVLKNGFKFNEELATDLKQLVRNKVGAFAVPDKLHPVSGLPKTRSGKIMRRILRKFVRNETDLGDLSTLADPTVIRELYAARA
jgi:acetyl-CoA synthetase